MSKVAIYGDVHITKNMRTMQTLWEESVTSSILDMYKRFDTSEVEFAVCLGDFFDKPVLEAKNLHLVLPILQFINNRPYPTYILLGNHEIDSSELNILEYLSEYDNIKPVIDRDIIREHFAFIPYSKSLEDIESEFIKDRYVFTHHDIYGSDLAGGKTKAFFGIDPSLFQEAKLVFNGHVHLKSKISQNIINTGSILISQHGELRVGEYPEYYILDAESGDIESFENRNSLIYLTINIDQVGDIIKKGYDTDKLILKVEYEGEIPKEFINTAHTSWRKLISDIDSPTRDIVRTTNFDLKNYLIEYIKKDTSISEERKEEYMKIGLEVIG